MTPEQEAHLERIKTRTSLGLDTKYRAGQIEHGGNIWQKQGLLEHAREEALDQIVYIETLIEQRPPGIVVYIAGPFRGPSAWHIEQNIRRAEALALEVWKLGAAALCPHCNTRFFQGAAEDGVWLKGDLWMLARCDALITSEGWEYSEGALAEITYARERGLPVFHTISDLDAWIKTRCAAPVVGEFTD